MSEKQIPTASTLTTSCVGRGAGTGFARLWTSCPAPTNWIACWVAGSAVGSAGRRGSGLHVVFLVGGRDAPAG